MSLASASETVSHCDPYYGAALLFCLPQLAVIRDTLALSEGGEQCIFE
jgi:hypothetical protein